MQLGTVIQFKIMLQIKNNHGYMNYVLLTGAGIAVAEIRVAVGVPKAVASAGQEVLEEVQGIFLGVVQRVPLPLLLRLRDEVVDGPVEGLSKVVPGTRGCNAKRTNWTLE